MSLFKNRQFSAGAGAIAAAFFALQGSTFYLAYYLQAIRDYTPLLAGTALIAVAAAVMTAAPLSTKLSGSLGPRVVVASGMVLLAVALAGYSLTTRNTPIWVIEVQLAMFGFGMGLTMSPATNSIMNAVPREKAGAGSAVNNTVRQVAGALGVAILGSVVAVVFRNQLGADTPHELARQLDQPSAVVSQLPKAAQVSHALGADTSQSIGNALEFVGKTATALKAREAATGTAPSTAQMAQARSAVTGFLDSAKDSFMSAMHVTSLFAALAGLIGAVVAGLFLPGRREFGLQLRGPVGAPAATDPPGAEHEAQHLDSAAPVPAAHAAHDPKHASND